MRKEIFLQFNQVCPVYKEYMDYRTMQENINEAYKYFSISMGIESRSVRPLSNSLIILATPIDINRYGSQLSKPFHPDTFCMFKKNSFIGKAWIKTTSELNIKSFPKPIYSSYFPSSVKLEIEFDYHGCVFIRLAGDIESDLPQGCRIISGSKFYQLLEEKQRADAKLQFVA